MFQRITIKYYYARTSMIDSQIGRLYDYLKEDDKLDDTVIIFTADHGETLGSHGGLLDKGWHHFEETHRIPLIVRIPDSDKKGVANSGFQVSTNSTNSGRILPISFNPTLFLL